MAHSSTDTDHHIPTPTTAQACRRMDCNLPIQRQTVSRGTACSYRTVKQGIGAHSHYDYDGLVREAFFDPINEMAQCGVGKFDFLAKIEAINAGAALASGVHYIPTNIAEIVEIPKRFKSMFQARAATADSARAATHP